MLESRVEIFLKDLVVDRGCSRATAESYRRDLALLDAFLVRRGREDAAEITTEDLGDFLGSRMTAGDGRRTRARRAATVRSFFKHLTSSGAIERNPALLLPTARRHKLLPRSLGPTLTARLLQAPLEVEPTPLVRRDRLVLELLYAAGLRASEAAGVRLFDVDAERGLVRVVGKGSRERRVPVGEPALAALEDYLSLGRPRLRRPDSPDRLLLSRTGRRLDRQALYGLVRRWAVRAGVTVPCSPHTLRHTFATHLVTGGADLRSVQELLGHASINTTQVYTTLAFERLREVHRKHHPRG